MTYQSYPHVIEELEECIKNLTENKNGCNGQELEEFKRAVEVLKREQREGLKKLVEL